MTVTDWLESKNGKTLKQDAYMSVAKSGIWQFFLD